MANNQLQIVNSADPTHPLTLVNFSNCIQLKDTITFRQWRFQVRAIMNGLELFSYLDGTTAAPPKTITVEPTPPDTKTTTAPNPAYSTWYRQDQLILGALTGTLAPPIAALIVNDTTSHAAWTTLCRTFANSSRGHRLQIKDRLENITHTDNMTITEYMTAIKACTDDLAQLEHPMDVDDITARILHGLNYDKYGSVIEAVRARDTSISFESLHEKLIQQELRLKHAPAPTVNPSTNFSPYANAAHTRQYHTNANSQTRPTYTPRTNQQNRNYTPKSNSQSGYSKPYKGRCHFCDEVGHVASDCRDFQAKYPDVVFPTRQRRGPTPQAHSASHPSTQPSNAWTIDSGASHHISDDLNTLSLHQPYDGDDLVIGDGSALSVTHTGKNDGSSSSSRVPY